MWTEAAVFHLLPPLHVPSQPFSVRPTESLQGTSGEIVRQHKLDWTQHLASRALDMNLMSNYMTSLLTILQRLNTMSV